MDFLDIEVILVGNSITTAKSILIRRHMKKRKYEIVVSERGIESFLGNVEEWLKGVERPLQDVTGN